MNNNHKISSSEKIAFLAPFLAVFMHIFCCGIPMLLAILGGVFGIYLNIPYFEESENTEIYMLIFSGIILVISFILYKKNTHCCCETHKKRKFYNKIILIIASTIYVISIFAHFIGYH